MAKISGTFTDDDQVSATWCSASAVVILNFGSGSVTIETYDEDNDNWVRHLTKTSDFSDVLPDFGKCQCRLNCTTGTTDIDYCVYT
ncbi:MAG: hypothetical protein GY761_03285 [Hyphomicrobiales bacterium]|nr:hypothetical protein [Hyphomicrobiales bacterium]